MEWHLVNAFLCTAQMCVTQWVHGYHTIPIQHVAQRLTFGVGTNRAADASPLTLDEGAIKKI
jgi:hypothetical protein